MTSAFRLADAAGFSTARVSATRAAAASPLGALSPLLTSLEATAGPVAVESGILVVATLRNGEPVPDAVLGGRPATGD